VSDAAGKPRVLFVCTKPYQYLICRLLREGYEPSQCDLLILNHFEDARRFSEAVASLRVWRKVFFEDDRALNERCRHLSIPQKLLFYKRFWTFLPKSIHDYSDYCRLYFAHDGVLMEYALMRIFAVQGKETIIYEEGFGNYVSVNLHVTPIRYVLKEVAHLLGLPGSYIGRSRYVKTILLQRPDLLEPENPVKQKAKPLPLPLRDFLARRHILDEMVHLYPELLELKSRISWGDAVALLLGESWWDSIPDKLHYLRSIIATMKAVMDACSTTILLKQHPGEKARIDEASLGVELVPKRLPVELLAPIFYTRRRPVYIFSFGSTAVFNLCTLLADSVDIRVIILLDPNLDKATKRGCERALWLLDKWGIHHRTVDVRDATGG